MIPLTTFYDDYIDRPKFTEQKNLFEYTVPLPTTVGRNKYRSYTNMDKPMKILNNKAKHDRIVSEQFLSND